MQFNMQGKCTTKKSGKDLHSLIKFRQRCKLYFVGFRIRKESVSPVVKHTATQSYFDNNLWYINIFKSYVTEKLTLCSYFDEKIILQKMKKRTSSFQNLC